MPAGRPPKYETKEEMQRIIDLYFIACKLNHLEQIDVDIEDKKKTYSDDEISIIDYIDDVAPTVSGLAYALGMSTEALRNYQDKDEFLATVKKGKQRIEMFLEGRLYGQAVTGSIFNLKNNFGWKDKSEQELSGPGGGPIETTTNINFIPVGKNK